MREFAGVYRGFTATDDSEIGIGEIEITVGDTMIAVRRATGLKIEESEIAISGFTAMSPEKVRRELGVHGRDSTLPERITGFEGSSGYPRFFFVRDVQEDEVGLIFVASSAIKDLLDADILFNPAQVARGEFLRAIAYAEEGSEMVGFVPLLENDGKAVND